MQTPTFFRRNTLIAGCLAAILSFAVQAAPLGGGAPQSPAFAMGHGEAGPGMEELLPPQPVFLRGLELSEAQRDEDEVWLHTHGLARCGLPEIEILDAGKKPELAAQRVCRFAEHILGHK